MSAQFAESVAVPEPPKALWDEVCKVWWDNEGDMWKDGWEEGYRAGYAAHAADVLTRMAEEDGDYAPEHNDGEVCE